MADTTDFDDETFWRDLLTFAASAATFAGVPALAGKVEVARRDSWTQIGLARDLAYTSKILAAGVESAHLAPLANAYAASLRAIAKAA